MASWLIILAGTLAGGLLLLHGFAKAKEVSDGMLDCYQDLLKQARERKKDRKSSPPGPDRGE